MDPATKQLRFRNDLGYSDDFIPRIRPDTPDADSISSHIPNIALMETDADTLARDEDNFIHSVGQQRIDQLIFLLDLDRDDTAFPDVAEVCQIRLFHDPGPGGKHDMECWIPCPLVASGVAGLINGLDPQRCGDFFFWTQLQQIGDRAALGSAAHFRDFIDFFHVAAACLGEEHEGIMGAGREKVFHEIALIPADLRFTGGHPDDAPTAASSGREIRFRLSV